MSNNALIKSASTIGHIKGSRMDPSDFLLPVSAQKIITRKERYKNLRVYVQEMMDGTSVSIALVDGKILPLLKSGALANTSPTLEHQYFYDWAMDNKDRFHHILCEGERICGVWLLKAHGTHYRLIHEPFMAYELIKDNRRLINRIFELRLQGEFQLPSQQCWPQTPEEASHHFTALGHHGATEQIEGFIWRCENVEAEQVEFLAQYVFPSKIKDKYLIKKNGLDVNPWNDGKPVLDILYRYRDKKIEKAMV